MYIDTDRAGDLGFIAALHGMSGLSNPFVVQDADGQRCELWQAWALGHLDGILQESTRH